MLYKFVNSMVRAHGRVNSRFFSLIFAGVELDKDVVCFFGKFY